MSFTRNLRHRSSRLTPSPTIAPTGQARGLKAHDLKRLGARIGVTAGLHTWGSALTTSPVHTSRSLPGSVEGEIQTHRWGRIAHMADPFGHGICFIQLLGRGYDEIAHA